MDRFIEEVRSLAEMADKCNREARMARTLLMRKIISYPNTYIISRHREKKLPDEEERNYGDHNQTDECNPLPEIHLLKAYTKIGRYQEVAVWVVSVTIASYRDSQQATLVCLVPLLQMCCATNVIMGSLKCMTA